MSWSFLALVAVVAAQQASPETLSPEQHTALHAVYSGLGASIRSLWSALNFFVKGCPLSLCVRFDIGSPCRSSDTGALIRCASGNVVALYTMSFSVEIASHNLQLRELANFNEVVAGTLPTQLARLTALTLLSLSNNAIQGTIPTGLVALSLLQTLRLDSNLLVGNVPPLSAPVCFLGNNCLNCEAANPMCTCNVILAKCPITIPPPAPTTQPTPPPTPPPPTEAPTDPPPITPPPTPPPPTPKPTPAPTPVQIPLTLPPQLDVNTTAETTLPPPTSPTTTTAAAAVESTAAPVSTAAETLDIALVAGAAGGGGGALLLLVAGIVLLTACRKKRQAQRSPDRPLSEIVPPAPAQTQSQVYNSLPLRSSVGTPPSTTYASTHGLQPGSNDAFASVRSVHSGSDEPYSSFRAGADAYQTGNVSSVGGGGMYDVLRPEENTSDRYMSLPPDK